MADVPDPVPVDGYAYKRPLGHFGKTDETLIAEDDSVASERSPGFYRALLALVLIVCGVLSITTGVTALLGWPWGVIVFGILCLLVGVLLASASDGATSSKEEAA